MTSTHKIDSRMFGRDWWAQPLPARFASLDAQRAGLAVSVEPRKGRQFAGMFVIVWRGTAEQFAATASFPRGIPAKITRGRYVCPGPLRGTIYPDGHGSFAFEIEWCFTDGRRHIKQHAQLAQADEKYLDFRDAVMAGFPLAGLITVEAALDVRPAVKGAIGGRK